ncbi:MAG: ABC transporter permease [Bacteroidia bacterium]
MINFFAFVRKEFYHIFRDRRTLLILFGMPVVQVILFGFAITNEIKDARIVVFDQSQDESSQQITQKLLSSGYFLLDRQLNEAEEMEQVFREGKTKLAVVFGPNFGERFRRGSGADIQLIADATDPNTANVLISYATAIIRGWQAEKMGVRALPLTINAEYQMTYNPELKGVFLFVPGVMTMILMMVSTLLTSIAVTREKELGTMEVLLASPLNPPVIIVGKVIPYLGLGVINAGVIVLLSYLVFGLPIYGSPILLMAECILFVVTCLALGILISTVSNSQQTAMLFSLSGLMLPTILLSGYIFPIENMPWLLQVFSNIIPAKWFIIIVKDIMLKGSGLGAIWRESVVLLGMTAVFILISIKRFKVRLE